MQHPIARPNSFALVKKLVKVLSVLFGKKSPEALETNSIVNESIVK